MDPYEKEQVEIPFIEQLRGYGYTYLTNIELVQERSSQASVLLVERFSYKIRRFNPWFDENNVE